MARKDVAFKLRIEEELRRAFLEVCREEDRPAAQVVREFMRGYVADHRAASQVEPISERKGDNPENEHSRKKGS
jgi:hypothetical protein